MRSLPCRTSLFVLPAVALLAGGCASGSSTAGTPVLPEPETPVEVWESIWRDLPTPMTDAPRVALGEILLLGAADWGLPPTVSSQVAVLELMAAQLVERTDVDFVERRRFGAAAERDRRGELAPRGQPPLGTSRGADYLLLGTWFPTGTVGAADLRLTDAETGEVVAAWRTETTLSPDPTSLTRAMCGGLLEALADLNHPSGDGPIPLDGGFRAAGISLAAQQSFFRGISAEDRFDWEAARESYQTAADLGGGEFAEAVVAVGRVARFRLGGSLAAGR